MPTGTRPLNGSMIITTGKQIQIPNLRFARHEKLYCPCQKHFFVIFSQRAVIRGIYLIVYVFCAVQIFHISTTGHHCINEALDSSRIKTYLKNSLYPLMALFGKNSMPDVDNLLTSFYQLDDEARQEIVETIQFKLKYHKDPERAENVKQIKRW